MQTGESKQRRAPMKLTGDDRPIYPHFQDKVTPKVTIDFWVAFRYRLNMDFTVYGAMMEPIYLTSINSPDAQK